MTDPIDTDLPIPLYKGKAASVVMPAVEDYTGEIEDGDTLTLRIGTLDAYNDAAAASVAALIEVTATAAVADGTLNVTFELTAEHTGALTAGSQGDGATLHRYQVLPPDDGYPLFDGLCVVRRAWGGPSA